MSKELELINSVNWLSASHKISKHAGSWDFEYLENKNRITRIYSHSCTMSYVESNTLKVFLLSNGETPTGNGRLISFTPLEENMAHLLIDVEDIVLNITTHITSEDNKKLDEVHSIQLIELVVDDMEVVHKLFSIWAMQYLPLEQIRSEKDLLVQIDLLLSLNSSSYIPGLVNSSRDIAALVAGGVNPISGVVKSKSSIIRLK